MRLISIPFSHFNERARWALDHFGLPYEERAYMPILHMPAVWMATRGRGGRADQHSSRFSTPVLVLDDGRCLCDSGEIVRWADSEFATPDTTLYPKTQRAAIEALEQELVQRLGAHTRRVAYFLALGQRGVLERTALRNVGAGQARLFGWVAPFVVAAIRRGLRVDRSGFERSLAAVRAALDELALRYDDGQRYVCGERFSAADLTLASLLAPVYLPSQAEGYGAALPASDELDAEAVALVRSMREHPVVQRCVRLFANERPKRMRASRA
jgi:glutathione S-transferase